MVEEETNEFALPFAIIFGIYAVFIILMYMNQGNFSIEFFRFFENKFLKYSPFFVAVFVGYVYRKDIFRKNN